MELHSNIFENLCTPAALLAGWARVLANVGGPGGDRVTVHSFGHNLDGEIARLRADLASGAYRPGPLRRTAIPKRSGGSRPLAIPCVRDRVAQSALRLLLEPRLEPTFSDASFGYRPGRGVTEAVARVQELYREGYRHVVDADIERFFEHVPHGPLLVRLGEAIQEPPVVRLIGRWLSAEPEARGLPQGSPISPLLSNFYLDHLDDRLTGRGVRLVRFADDFLVLCRSPDGAGAALERVRDILGELGLRLNLDKTRLIDFDRGFQFLGRKFVKSFVLAGTVLEEEEEDEAMSIAGPSGAWSAGNPMDAALPAPADANAAPRLTPAPNATPPQTLDAGTPENAPAAEGAPATHDLAPVLRPLYLLTPGRRLSLRGEAFAVMEDGQTVALLAPRRLDRIEIGPDAEADGNALRQALAYGIHVAYVSGSGRTLGTLAPPPDHGARHLAQAGTRLDPRRGLAIARAFAGARIRNQRALLNRLNRRRKHSAVAETASKIGRIALKLGIALREDAVRGVEGEAAALYWPALGQMFEHGFGLTRRERQPPASPTDLILNYAAGLLARDVETLLLRHGLHPGIGFLHGARDLEAPLAWDIMEPFRAPLVEGFAVYLVNNRVLRAAEFDRREDGSLVMAPDARLSLTRAYEGWLARPVRNHRLGSDTVWRGLIEHDILALIRTIQEDEPFEPYVMDY
ncbi:CRISPR-associated endonuclease Cas1 [Ancylobacter sp. WKF20]|uniref:CRISPR-associated endonuclease Cas1 n=1 Tax=Ancylobacter sp. WKF20 TaxID=3039801 RepID=UPI0024343EF9|nr:CRISPR-associated endonuclease Cas1 [Ancylobacter sp. WKF20]WGD28404.1 CRISPR-associated endonuclease Cas1 [Ancylobacter sp. WKF20]